MFMLLDQVLWLRGAQVTVPQVANGGSIPITEVKLRLDKRSAPFAKQDLMRAASMQAQKGVLLLEFNMIR